MRILIVEDEGLIAMEIEDTVVELGHDVVGWEASADSAIASFDAHLPDLILLDIELLQSSGLEVARHVQRATKSRFVFLTANPAKLEGEFFGAIGVMSKPFTSESLKASLHYLHEGVCDPPPKRGLPHGLRLGPDYNAIWA
ncbi:response regulator [Pararhizobium mangrovi]|nr:response regulator [Pararhizobium mangrovi]